MVWDNVFAELASLQENTSEFGEPPWVKDLHTPEDEINETERMWRDPSAHKVRMAVVNWLENESVKSAVIEVIFS